MTAQNGPHAWLCVDPGIATGWAVLDDDGNIIATSVWGTHELHDSLDLLARTLFTMGYRIDAVVELMPSVGGVGRLAKKLEWIRRDVMHVLENVYEIRTRVIAPGTWKTSRVARTAILPSQFDDDALTVHQKDAIRMGLWAIEESERRR
jgi:hypothetical protein